MNKFGFIICKTYKLRERVSTSKTQQVIVNQSTQKLIISIHGVAK